MTDETLGGTLGAEALRAAGIPAPWTYGVADRVRFGELDVLNHVNNAVYLVWFEALRVRYMLDYGVSTYAAEDDPTLVVRSQSADYLAPLHLEAPYIVTARTVSFRRTSFRQDYAVYSEGKLTTTGSVVVVMLDPAGRAKLAIPEAVLETFQSRDGAVAKG